MAPLHRHCVRGKPITVQPESACIRLIRVNPRKAFVLAHAKTKPPTKPPATPDRPQEGRTVPPDRGSTNSKHRRISGSRQSPTVGLRRQQQTVMTALPDHSNDHRLIRTHTGLRHRRPNAHVRPTMPHAAWMHASPAFNGPHHFASSSAYRSAAWQPGPMMPDSDP